MKLLTLKNLYTGGYKAKEVKDDLTVRIGQVISFKEDIVDRDYKLYKVIKIEVIR